MSSKNLVTSVCLVCNDNCMVKDGFHVFTYKAGLGLSEDLASILSKILNKDIKEDPDVSPQIVCKKCFRLAQELDELQNRVSKIKHEILDNYNGVEGSKQESDEDKPLTKSVESNKENQVPKKLLFIPESDDESSQIPTDRNLDELEMITIQSGVLDNEDQERNNVVQMEVDESSFHDFSVEDGDILDSGAVDHSSDSDYEPPSMINADEFVKAVKVSEKHLVNNMKIKIESSCEESANTKPNILKRKAVPSSPSSEPEQKKVSDFYTLSVVAREDNIYTCLLCQGDETVAGEAKAIMAHVKEAHGVRLYICDVCGQVFQKRNLLSAHLDEHVAAEDGDFQCEVCNRIFSNLRLFRIHKRMHYPQNKAWDCDTCGKKYSSKNLLDEHLNTHLGLRPYVCSLCGKDFASKYTCKAHEKTHEVRPRPFTCNICSKSFLSQQNLTQHERTHTGMKECTCHLCGKMFGSKHNLEVHSIIHTGYKPYVCGKCGKAFARKAEIRDHERTHTGERPFDCEFCGASFSQRSNLQSHKRATHYNDKRYQCKECGKGFKRRRLLDYHMKAAHTGERPFKCEVCEATFVYPEHFKKHRRIHTGEKPFLCEVCGKAFNSRDNRNAHRFIHSDKKPYECLVCGAGFMRKPMLYQHMQARGHLNDTIVVNQPRLTTEDDQLVTVNSAGELEIVDAATAAVADSKVYIQDQDGNEHIIIDGQQISFAEAASDEENEGEVIDEIEQVVAGQVIEQDETGSFLVEGDYEEIITADSLSTETQLIDTPDVQVRLVKVRIPNEHGVEEEAWIKIVPE